MVPNRPSFSASCLCTTFYHRSLLLLPRKKSLSVVGKRDRVATQMEVKKRRTEIEGEEERVVVVKTGTLRLVHTHTHLFRVLLQLLRPRRYFLLLSPFIFSCVPSRWAGHPLRNMQHLDNRCCPGE